jgi:hypothetical protein
MRFAWLGLWMVAIWLTALGSGAAQGGERLLEFHFTPTKRAASSWIRWP